jgi:hypothetical protein
MTKRGFNILVEQEYIDIIEAYRIHFGIDNSTEAFRRIMSNLRIELQLDKELEHIDRMRRKEERLRGFALAAENITSDKNTLESASIANKRKNAGQKNGAGSKTS